MQVTVGAETAGCRNRKPFFCADHRPICYQHTVTLENRMTRIRTSLLALIALLALTACETVQGAGRDISTVGSVITEGSQEVQQGL